MFNTKFIISTTIIIFFLILTSIIKNKTRIIEKQISILNTNINVKKKDINETQLDFYYLTSPIEIEKKINLVGFDNYQPIKFSKIFFDILHFNQLQNKISNLKN
jgi:hypothetical protein